MSVSVCYNFLMWVHGNNLNGNWPMIQNTEYENDHEFLVIIIIHRLERKSVV